MATELQNKTNPNGANQYVSDPRQELFLSYYLDPKSKTFSNAFRSAKKAGFSEAYSTLITAKKPTWLVEKVNEFKSKRMLENAERNLDELLDLPSKVQAMGAFGPLWKDKKKKKPLMTYASTLLKIKNDASQFVAERLGRSKYGDESGGNKTLVLVVTGETAQGYGIVSTPIAEPSSS